MADLERTLSLIGCRLRLKCNCNHCTVLQKNRTRASQGPGIDLAELLDTDLGCSSAGLPPQKVSVVSQLPMPAGGFCRRSAAVQWALAQEMSRQAAAESEEEGFDCANEDWPALFAVDDLDDDLGFDFELVSAEDDDEFVLELIEDDEGDLDDGEWARISERCCKISTGPGTPMDPPAQSLTLDFKTAISRHSVPAAPEILLSTCKVEIAEAEAGAEQDKDHKVKESTEEWPLLAGGPSATFTSCSPTSVSDIAAQWVSVVEKSKEVRVPSDDKKSRNFREACKRTVAQIRRAEKKAAQRKAKLAPPAEEFPPLPV